MPSSGLTPRWTRSPGAPVWGSGRCTGAFPPRASWPGGHRPGIAEDLSPEIERALRSRNPLRGLAKLIEAAIALGARQHNALTAARQAGSLTDVSVQLDEALHELTLRAQDAGLVRADLVAEDLPRMVAMLYSVLGTMDPASDGWRRYVALMIDAISTSNPTRLPRAVPIQFTQALQEWPI